MRWLRISEHSAKQNAAVSSRGVCVDKGLLAFGKPVFGFLDLA